MQARELVIDEASSRKWHGVGVLLCSSKEQDHIGVVTDDDGVSILHLTRHDSLRHESIASLFVNYSYKTALVTRPDLPPERAIMLNAVCRRIHKKQGSRLPFGFGDWRSAFSDDGAYSPDVPRRTGLTCSTFVLSVLELAGYVVFDFDTWPSRNDDFPWQIAMVKSMRKAKAPEDHLAAVDASVDGRRFRPAEVAAGFAALPEKLTQAIAEERGRLLRKKVL